MSLQFKPKVIRLTDEVLKERLQELESRYGMDSDAFLLKFNTGELGDDGEFIRWAGLLAMANRARRRASVRA